MTCVGSSGSVVGIAGVLISLLVFAKPDIHKRNRRSILLWAVLLTPVSIISGLYSSEVDSAGHLGGFVSGLVIGAILSWTMRSSAAKCHLRQRWVLACVPLVLIIVFAALSKVRSDVVELYVGERALGHDPAAAIFHIQKYVNRNPKDATGHEYMGAAYEQVSKYREAASEYQRSLEIDPVNPVTKYDLARMYTLDRPQDAVPLYRESILQLPENSDRYYNFATALQLINNLKEAENAAQKAVALDPKSVQKHKLLAIILLQLGKPDLSKNEFRLAEQPTSPNSK